MFGFRVPGRVKWRTIFRGSFRLWSKRRLASQVLGVARVPVERVGFDELDFVLFHLVVHPEYVEVLVDRPRLADRLLADGWPTTSRRSQRPSPSRSARRSTFISPGSPAPEFSTDFRDTLRSRSCRASAPRHPSRRIRSWSFPGRVRRFHRYPLSPRR